MVRARRLLTVPPLHLVERARRSPPIFQIGFNKCGTTSLHRFLCDSGIISAHWRQGHLAARIMARIEAGQDPIRDFPGIIGFTDMNAFEEGRLIEPYKRFDYLHRWYPDALFILNTRDRESWVASRRAHVYGGKRLIDTYAQCLNIGETQVLDFWRAEWETHHTLVRAYFARSANFLEFNIQEDHPDKLRRFLVPRYESCAETPFGMHNPTVVQPAVAAAST